MATNNSSSLFPRRQLGWQAKINTGQYLALYENDQETDVRRIANLIADELEKASLAGFESAARRERNELVEDFRLVGNDVEELDDVLTRMYDWGDHYRIWFSHVLDAKAQTNDNDYDWRADHNVYPFDTVVVWPDDAPRGTTALDALPTDLSAYATMSLNDLRECHLQLPALLQRDVITPDEYEARLRIVEIAEHMRRYESRIAEMQGALEWERERLRRWLPAAAQPTTPAVAATPDGYVVKHFDCCQGNDETCPGCDNGYGRDVLYKIDPEQPAQQPFAVTLTGTTQPEAARAGAKRVGVLDNLGWNELKAGEKYWYSGDDEHPVTVARINRYSKGALKGDIKSISVIYADGEREIVDGGMFYLERPGYMGGAS